MINFSRRRNHAWLQAIKIMRLIFNGGGFPILVGICLILFYISYTRLLEILSPDIWITPWMALFISIFMTFSPFRTWIQTADLTFLLPMEHKLSNYFKSCLKYNILIQMLRTSLLFFLLYPLYRFQLGDSKSYLITFLLLMGYQIIHTWFTWYQIKVGTPWTKWVLLGYNFLFMIVLLENIWYLSMGMGLGLFAFLLYLRKIIPTHPWPWRVLVTHEQKRVAFYQKIASWFIDLPGKQKAIQQRNIWIFLLRLFEQQPRSFSYLYWRRFIRDRDYFMPYIHLLGMTTLMMWILSNPYIVLAIFVTSLAIFSIQFLTLKNTELYPVWIRLYPKSIKKGLSQVSLVLLGLQSTLLSSIVWLITNQFLFSMTLLAIGWGYNLIYSYWYLPYRQRKDAYSPD